MYCSNTLKYRLNKGLISHIYIISIMIQGLFKYLYLLNLAPDKNLCRPPTFFYLSFSGTIFFHSQEMVYGILP